MTEGFYNGKKIFITGHTGFKGSWLSLWLNKEGACVTGYALEPSTNPAMFDICGLKERIHSVIGDIRDGKSLYTVLEKERPEIVFHLAAQPLVRYSYENPVETYESNVMGTVNLLDAVRKCPSVKAVVIVTSDKCYENQESFYGYRETDRLGGYDPYSSSKACQELVASAYVSSFFNPSEYGKHGIAIATARAGNVIGGGDFSADRLMPDSIRSIMKGEQLSIRNPNAIRPWQHVLDPLRGYLILAEKLFTEGVQYNGAWNFGPDMDQVKTVEWLIEKTQEIWGKDIGFHLDYGQNLHETQCLKLDSYKARELLHFKPGLTAEMAVGYTINWLKAYLAGTDMAQFTMDQIEEFESR